MRLQHPPRLGQRAQHPGLRVHPDHALASERVQRMAHGGRPDGLAQHRDGMPVLERPGTGKRQRLQSDHFERNATGRGFAQADAKHAQSRIVAQAVAGQDAGGRQQARRGDGQDRPGCR